MGGDQQQGVEQAPPVRLGQIPADGLRQHGHRGH
jgi:hypothetical protein